MFTPDAESIAPYGTSPYLLGVRAGKGGHSTFTNPYPANTLEHEQWRQGYFSTQEAA